MKKIIIKSILTLLFIAPFLACKNRESDIKQPPDNDTEAETGYKLVWEDLFDGSTLNKSNWTIEVNGDGGGNSELQYYKEDNISVGKEPETGSNCLIITAKKENYMGKKATSGRINTIGKYSFKYGKLEARIKFPKTANGLWPAFWMLGADFPQVGWPKSGEVDIVEMGNDYGIKNNLQDKYFNGACHWGPNANSVASNAKHITASYGLQDGFHLYTLIWDEQAIKMYLDLDKNPEALPYYEMNITSVENDKSPGKYFNKEFSILFNLAVGGNFTQIWDINQITGLAGGEANMYVDYVKVYQKNAQ
ncbi:glycoside hydrolase family 16 protein (plasmid) [Pedobacter sp. BS3]|uniref:glycoside hydrolase family 16 protein n=1 Tax=Pedobacter sp. BS3 TaxID=2567937 RepID=UPI0011ECB29F|nr:glycoside hydrolase family 16 protein [Pedobacter sp. BS3]TZF86004.1 glycoside hydrolase family 16 protein [Pedobacter sp. BS3]